MAKKTVLKAVLKYAPIKTEFLQAVAVDEKTVEAKDGNFENLEVAYTIGEAEEPAEE